MYNCPLYKSLLRFYNGVMGYGGECHFQQYFSYIVAVSFIGGGNRSSEENHWPAASHRQIL